MENPSSDEPEGPVDPLQMLVDEVLAMVAPGLRELQAIIARGIELDLPPGEMAYLRQVISKAHKVAPDVLRRLHRDQLSADPKHGILHDPARVAGAVVATLKDAYQEVVWTLGCLYHYADVSGEDDLEAGYFSRCEPDELESFLLQQYGTLPCLSTQAQRKEVIRRLAASLRDKRFFDGAPSGLNLTNGFLAYNAAKGDVELLPSDPEHRARSRLAVMYDRTADAPVFRAGLARMFRDTASAEAFLAFVGCMLLGVTSAWDNARHVCAFKGPANGGKSTLLKILRLLVPAYATSSVPPSKWTNEYYLAKLAGKIMNLVTEFGRSKLVSGDIFKAVVGFDDVTARSPFGEPFEFRPSVWTVLAGNSVPKTDDQDPAFERRILGILVDRSLRPEEIDPLFLDKVKGELAGVVTLAVEAACRAMRSGHFVLPPGHREIVAEMQFGDDLTTRFVMAKVEQAPGNLRGLSTKELHAAFVSFSQREGADTTGWRPETGARSIAGLLRKLYGATDYDLNGVPHYREVRLRAAPQQDAA